MPCQLFIGKDILEEPDASMSELLFELLDIVPIVLASLGIALLFRVANRQRDDNLKLLHDLDLARLQGLRWRTESRGILNGLGEAINTQFGRWNLTDAEREVALLLLKGLSRKEVATIRAVSERTVREQSRSVYTKSGLSGRTALSAFFLEDILAPIESVK